MNARTQPASHSGGALSKARRELKERGPTREYFHMLGRAVLRANPGAQAEFGAWLLEGRRDALGVVLRRSPRRAVALLRLAAEGHHAGAQLALANCYAAGTGVARDPKAAERWFRAAVRGGEYFAAFNLATMFRDRRDRRGERYWLKRAVGLGDETAHLVLLEMDLARGRGKAFESARKRLMRAARSSNKALREEACEILEHFERTGFRRWAPDSRRVDRGSAGAR